MSPVMSFRRDGRSWRDFPLGERVVSFDATSPEEVVLTLSSGATLSCDGVLVCAGCQSNTGTLDLTAAGITPGNRGLIPVDAHDRTCVSHIYVAGDVVGPPALAATGIEQARCAVAHAFGSTLKVEGLEFSGAYSEIRTTRAAHRHLPREQRLSEKF